jgi:hypothetical protein
MKSNTLKACGRIAHATSFAALLVLGGFTASAAQSFDPVGTTWDCLMNGSGQQGIAFLTFSHDRDAYGNFTFSGYQLLVGKQSNNGSSGSDRNPGGDVGRTETSNPTPVGSGTNLFGFASVNGPWRFDEKGRVIGYFLQLVNQQTTVTTNQDITTIGGQTIVYATNIDGSITSWVTNVFSYSTNTTYITNTIGTTNGVSFTAKGAQGKHLNLVSSTPNGKVTYNGVPQNQKPIPAPISGSWYGAKKQNNQTFVEFFDLRPTAVQNIFVTTNGNGPGFRFGGYSMLSVQKKMGFALATFPGLGTNDVPVDSAGNFSGGTLSATLGGISYPQKGAKANTKGFELPISPINFQAQRQGP